MKILFVIPCLTSGGAERALVTMLNKFDFSKYEIDLLILSDDNFYLEQLNNNVNILDKSVEISQIFSPLKQTIVSCIKQKKLGVIIPRIKIALKYRLYKILGRDEKTYEIWDIQKQMIREMDETYDIAIGYLQGTSIYYVVDKVKAKRKFGWIHNDYEQAKMSKDYDKNYFEQLDSVFAVSNSIANRLKVIFPEYSNKIRTMYNIVSYDMIKEMAKEKVNFDSNYEGIKILTIGRLHPQKGYNLALEVCKKLNDSNIDFKWYVIGKGKLDNEILKQVKRFDIEDRFILLGEIKNPYSYIKECDIYVQPSLYEGFGIVVQEAKILNKPIIVTDCPSMEEQIQSGINGLVVKKSSDDLYNGLMKLIKNERLRQQFENELSKFRYSSEKEIEILYEILDEVSK